jgi:hypothetical protein
MREPLVRDKEKNKSSKKKILELLTVERKDRAVDVDMIEVDEDKMHEEMRISIKVSNTCSHDQQDVERANEYTTPQHHRWPDDTSNISSNGILEQ